MRKIAFIFPGQGSQSPGMGKDVSDNYPAAAAAFAAADRILGQPLAELCFHGPAEALKDTRISQPAIVTTSLALHRVLVDEGVKPDFVAGHSLGEYCALVAAGAIDFTTALQLIQFRAQCMAEADPEGQGGMAAVLGLARDVLETAVAEAAPHGKVEAANFNCPGQIVVSGNKNGLQQLRELVAARGGKFIPLAVSGPFHSSFMKNAADRLRPKLDQVTWNELQCPLIANVTARPASLQDLTENLYRQVFSPVFWEDTLSFLALHGVDTFIEVGPGKVLSGLVKKTVKEATILNCEDTASLQKTLATLRA